MPRRLLLLILLTGLLAGPVPAVLAEDQPSEISISKLREDISEHQGHIDQNVRQERSLLDELATLDSRMDEQKAKIRVLNGKIQEQNQVIAVQEAKLAAIAEKTAGLRQHLLKRLRSFYLLGHAGFLNVAFSKKTLPELMLTNDAFQSLATYDQSVFAEYRESRAAIERVKQAHELDKGVQEHFLADAAAQSASLNQLATEKNQLLARIQTEKGLHQRAIQEMKKAESALTATLNKATQSGKTDQNTKASRGGIVGQRGKLAPPVWGTLIRRFHQATDDESEATFANGITIEPPDQAEVIAVYGGAVIYAGYMSGYGKMVIIEHDQHYYTITARLETILVGEGDTVTQGQAIGTAGDEDTASGRGVYFEIRHDTEPDNPLNWLQSGLRTKR